MLYTSNYAGEDIVFEFNEKIMVNATQMARPFKKHPTDFLKTRRAKNFMLAISEITQLSISDLVVVKQGGCPEEQGTWMCEELALEFARWLSLEFAVWCNTEIKHLTRLGELRQSTKTWKFKEKINNLISMVESLPEREFLIDLYKLLK